MKDFSEFEKTVHDALESYKAENPGQPINDRLEDEALTIIRVLKAYHEWVNS